MKIDPVQFKQLYRRKAAEHLSSGLPQDTVERSIGEQVLSSHAVHRTESAKLGKPAAELLSFEATLKALAAASPVGGIPVMAAVAQQVAQEIITPEQEQHAAATIRSQFESKIETNQPRVDETWQAVSQLVNSPFTPPEVVDSFLVDAQADSRNIFLGKNSLKGDFSNEVVLAFTLAHEEAHRQNRDTAGSVGLETLTQVCREDEELYPLTFQAFAYGKKENEFEADEFAARVLKEMDADPSAVYSFLESSPGDLQHPPGKDRAKRVRDTLGEY